MCEGVGAKVERRGSGWEGIVCCCRGGGGMDGMGWNRKLDGVRDGEFEVFTSPLSNTVSDVSGDAWLFV